MVQASILELGGHVDVVSDAFLHPWEPRDLFWTVSGSRTPPAILRTRSAGSCHLRVSGSPLVIVQLCQTQSLLSKHPDFLQLQLQLLTNNLCNFVGFALISVCVCVCVCSVMSDSSCTPWTVACQILCPWDSPGKNTGVGCHALLQGIFLTQESNPSLLHWQAGSLLLCHLRSLDQSPAFVVQWNTIQVLLESVSPRL